MSLHEKAENGAMCPNTFDPVSGQMKNSSGESSLAWELYVLAQSNLRIVMMNTYLFHHCGPFPNWDKVALQLKKAFAFFAGIRWPRTFNWSRGQKPSNQQPKQPRKPLLLLPELWSDMIDRVCVILLDAYHLWPHLFSQESARFPRRWPTMYFLDLASRQWFSACVSAKGDTVVATRCTPKLLLFIIKLQWLRKN